MPRVNLPAFTHAPWDGGAVTEIFAGVLPPQKTIATRCKRRVKLAQAPADVPPTCPACIAELENEKHAHAVIQKYVEDLQAHGLEYANAQASKGER